MYAISQIFIYPVKSLAGISLTESNVDSKGLEYDRRWMLCDENNVFITQRNFSELALFKTSFNTIKNGFIINYFNESFEIPFEIIGKEEPVKVWDDTCEAIEFTEGSKWFSNALSAKIKLFYMPNFSKRLVDKQYAKNNETTSFSDGFPILLLGEQSLNELNNRLEQKIEINRFRPNIVFSGGNPFDEDNFKYFEINENLFYAAKPCGRCVVININQNSAESTPETLKTLATFRKENNKVLFGMNCLVVEIKDKIKIGQALILKS